MRERKLDQVLESALQWFDGATHYKELELPVEPAWVGWARELFPSPATAERNRIRAIILKKMTEVTYRRPELVQFAQSIIDEMDGVVNPSEGKVGKESGTK